MLTNLWHTSECQPKTGMNKRSQCSPPGCGASIRFWCISNGPTLNAKLHWHNEIGHSATARYHAERRGRRGLCVEGRERILKATLERGVTGAGIEPAAYGLKVRCSTN